MGFFKYFFGLVCVSAFDGLITIMHGYQFLLYITYNQASQYLSAVKGGTPNIKGISLFILHSQSGDGCHRTNNPGFHLTEEQK